MSLRTTVLFEGGERHIIMILVSGLRGHSPEFVNSVEHSS
jgi:hypothetical protein